MRKRRGFTVTDSPGLAPDSMRPLKGRGGTVILFAIIAQFCRDVTCFLWGSCGGLPAASTVFFVGAVHERPAACHTAAPLRPGQCKEVALYSRDVHERPLRSRSADCALQETAPSTSRRYTVLSGESGSLVVCRFIDLISKALIS